MLSNQFQELRSNFNNDLNGITTSGNIYQLEYEDCEISNAFGENCTNELSQHELEDQIGDIKLFAITYITIIGHSIALLFLVLSISILSYLKYATVLQIS